MTDGTTRLLFTAVFTVIYLSFIAFRYKKINTAGYFFKTDNDHLVRKSPVVRKPKVYNHVHKCFNRPLAWSVQYTPSHTYFFKNHFNITLPCTVYPHQGFPTIIMLAFLISHACCIFGQFNPLLTYKTVLSWVTEPCSSVDGYQSYLQP
jgi:hypothetical protein